MKKLIFTLIALVLLVSPLAAKDIGPFVESASAQRDTTTIGALYIYIGGQSVIGKYLYVSYTTDGAAPLNECCVILEHTQTSGLVIVDVNVEGGGTDAEVGFSADLTDGDKLWIMDSPPEGSLIRGALTATKVASGVAPLNYTLYLQNTAEAIEDTLNALVGRRLAYLAVVDGNLTANTAFGDAEFGTFRDGWFSTQNNWCVLVHQATQAGIEDEIRLITGFAQDGGVFTTVDIGAAYTVDDSIYIVPRSLFPEGTALVDRTGDLTDVTAPELSDGTETMISMLRGLMDRNLAYRVVVDGNVTANTAFGDADFASFDDGWFSTQGHWTAMVYTATQAAIEDEVRLITGFAQTDGIFTTDDIGAAYTVGDVIYIVPRALFPEGNSIVARLDAIDDFIDTEVATIVTSIALIEDSLQSATQIRIQSMTFYCQPADADTTAFALVNDSTVVIIRIEAIVTQAGVGAQNLQLVSDGGGGGVHTSFGADLDFDTPIVGSRIYWDLSNPANAPASVSIGVPHFASDIFEEAVEVPSGTVLGFETGESPGTNCWFNLTIWYYTDGGSITAP